MSEQSFAFFFLFCISVPCETTFIFNWIGNELDIKLKKKKTKTVKNRNFSFQGLLFINSSCWWSNDRYCYRSFL